MENSSRIKRVALVTLFAIFSAAGDCSEPTYTYSVPIDSFYVNAGKYDSETMSIPYYDSVRGMSGDVVSASADIASRTETDLYAVEVYMENSFSRYGADGKDVFVLPGEYTYDFDGIINYDKTTGAIKQAIDSVYTPLATRIYVEDTWESFTSVQDLGLIDAGDINAINDGKVARDGKIKCIAIFPEPVDQLYVVAYPTGSPVPNVVNYTSGEIIAIDASSFDGVEFEFDRDMFEFAEFPSFIVSHNLGGDVTIAFASSTALSIAMPSTLPAGSDYYVILNPSGYAPLLRSTDGVPLPEFRIDFRTQ